MNISDFKQQYPAYASVPDVQLADALHQKFYSDIPRDAFMQQVGVADGGGDMSTGMDRSAYQQRFMADNPQANQDAVDAVMAQYDQQHAARAQAATDGKTAADAKAAALAKMTPDQQAEAQAAQQFSDRLNARLQGPQDGVPQLPANQQPYSFDDTAYHQPSTFDTVAGNLVGGVFGTAIGAGAAGLHLVGDDADAADWDTMRQQIQQRQKELGGDTFTGKVAGLVGGVVPALAAPEGAIEQAISNAGLFAIPAFQDTYKAKMAQGESRAAALAHAAEAFGLNMAAPTVMTKGLGAVVGKLGADGAQGLGGAALGLGQAAAEGAGFSAANSVLDKGTDLAFGQQNNRPWLDPEDMAVQATGFGAMRGAHLVAGIGASAPDLAQTDRQQQVLLDQIGQAADVNDAIAAASAAINTPVPSMPEPVDSILQIRQLEQQAAAAHDVAPAPLAGAMPNGRIEPMLSDTQLPADGALMAAASASARAAEPELANSVKSPVPAPAGTIEAPGGKEIPSVPVLDLPAALEAAPALDSTGNEVPAQPGGDSGGEAAPGRWYPFPPESGTLGIPRADMPQIQAEHRGAMTNFLNARGIDHEHVELPASSLKPTQAEFSMAKVDAAQAREDGDRSILVSSDGHVLDGHHQWLAAVERGEPVKAIRLNAPIHKLLDTVREFPSATMAEGTPQNEAQNISKNIPADMPQEDPVDALIKRLQPQADRLTDLRNAAVREFQAAKAAGDTPGMHAAKSKIDGFDARRRQMQHQIFLEGQKQVRQQQAVENSQKYGAMNVGTKVGMIGHEGSDDTYFQKVGLNRWQRTMGGRTDDVFKIDAQMEGERLIGGTPQREAMPVETGADHARQATEARAETEAVAQQRAETTRTPEESAAPAAAEAVPQVKLSIGKTPNSTEPISVRDGIVHIGDYPAQDYETGDDVTVPPDAAPQQIKEALAQAGAIARGHKIFGMPKEPAVIRWAPADASVPPERQMSQQALEALVHTTLAGLDNAPPVFILDSPHALAHEVGGVESVPVASGAMMNGKLFLFRDGIRSAAAARATIWHELFHYGLRKLMTPEAYSRAMSELYNTDPLVKQAADRWQRTEDAALRQASGVTVTDMHILSVEEALAYIAERVRDGGADYIGQREMPQAVRNILAWMAKLANQLRLPKIGEALRLMTRSQGERFIMSIFDRTAAGERPAEQTMADLGKGSINFSGSADDGAERAPAARRLPDAIIGDDLGALSKHPDYAAAKSGDIQAAVRVAGDVVQPDLVARVRALAGDQNPIIQPVTALESAGRNAIPALAAARLGAELGLDAGRDIVQSSSPKRTALPGLDRVFARPEFDGHVEPGRAYILVDDTITQGGTFAALAQHIEEGGGHVLGAVALTGKQYSAKMALSDSTLTKLRETHGDIEQQFRAAAGHGFDALTESEGRYLTNYRPADAVRNRIAARLQSRGDRRGPEGVQQEAKQVKPGEPGAAGDSAPAPSNGPVFRSAEPAEPESESDNAGSDKSGLSKLISVPKAALQSIVFHTRMLVVPMAAGDVKAMAMAKDFMNQVRRATAQWQAIDKVLRARYTPEQLEKMWVAADQENDLRREGRTSDTEGLASLNAGERKTVELLHAYGQELWTRAQKAGMVEGEGVAFWTPRIAARIDADGSAESIRKAFGGFSKDARNLRTTASSTKQRQHATTEESEAALKAKLGDDAAYVKNIRVMPMAMAHLERAIAGRTLVNQIKAHGKLAGVDLVSDGARPDFVTFDHPALQQYRPRADWQPADMAKIAARGYEVKADGVYHDGEKLASYRVRAGAVEKLGALMDSAGKPVLESTPLYIRKDFAGPLKAVLTKEQDRAYRAVMDLKGAVTSAIMVSPLTHNLVIWGKAMPSMISAMGWKNNLKNAGTLGLHGYFVGNAARADHALMSELVEAGLVPVSGRGMTEDAAAIHNGIEPGRSMVAKAIGAVFDAASAKAGDVARRGVDAAGEIWHEKLLWDRVADLQAGMAVMMRTSLMDKGIDQYTANRIAAHFANRYAGMIPHEAMSQGAHMLLNLSLFSKSFTMTNLGAYKDLLGLPKDVQAQLKVRAFEIQRALGKSEDEANKAAAGFVSQAQWVVRKKAAAVLLLDVGAMTMVGSITQALWQGQSGQQIADDLKERLAKLGLKIKDDPLSVIPFIGEPLDLLSSLSQTSDNPHGKQDRVRVGEDERGNSYYARLPVGKVGEEIKSYGNLLTGLHLAHDKLSTFVKPIAELTANEDFNGRQIIDPHANLVKQLATFGAYWVKAQLPVEDMAALAHVAKGDADPMDKLKLLGTATGLNVGRLAGGDAVAEMRYQMHEQEAVLRNVLPEVREAMRRDDVGQAQQLLEDAGQTPREIQRTLQRIDQPDRISKQQMRRFNQVATDEERERLEKMRSR